MPAKIDSRSFNYAKQVDTLLSLSNDHSIPHAIDSPDCATPGNEQGSSIWREISGNPDAVSSFIICLISKIISLDSGHGLRPLPQVYKEITELQVDVNKYKSWCNKEKQLTPPLRIQAGRMQQAIVATIFFLKQFYGYSPNQQLRNMYLRWNLARKQIAPAFETEVMAPFFNLSSKEVHDPSSSPCHSTIDASEEKLVRELINNCFYHHRRSFFGTVPSETCKLTMNQPVSCSLSYIRLKDILSRSPDLLRCAMDHIQSLLQSNISHTQDYGDREVLLPLLHLLHECLLMMVNIDYQKTYKLLMPFYTWPSSHSETVKEVLGGLLLERKSPGTLYRRTILREHQLDLNLSSNRPKQSHVLMLIDTSRECNHGNRLYQSMMYHQEMPPTILIKRLLLSSVLHSALHESSHHDISNIVCNLPEEALTPFCEEGIDLAEQAIAMETFEEAREFIEVRVGDLYKRLTVVADVEDYTAAQKTCHPTSFVLPPPYIPVHNMEYNHFQPIVEKLQDILTRLHRTNDTSSPYIGGGDGLNSYTPPISHGNSSPANLSGLSTDDLNGIDNGTHRPMSPVTVKSDPGGGLMVTHSVQPTDPSNGKRSPLLASKSLSLQVGGVTDGEGFGDLESDTSDTSSSKASEEVVSRVSTDSSSTTPSIRKLERRHTETFATMGGSRRNLTIRGSGVYPNQIISPTSSMGSFSLGGGLRGSVKLRANPTTFSGAMRPKRSHTMGGMVRPRLRTRQKKVKILLAGNDIFLCNVAKAYTHLKVREPNLLNNLDIEFYYIPLSKAVMSGFSQSPTSSSGFSDLPEPYRDQESAENGLDVLVGQYLAHIDTWYEQNVMLSMQNSLRLLLDDSNYIPRSFSMLEGLDTRWLPLPTPSRVMVSIASNFLREAKHPICVKMYRVKMTLRSDKVAKGFENRESYMLHRIDIQRLSNKKESKPYEASLALTELSLGNNFIKSDMVHMKDLWIIRGSNVPHQWDVGVPNPESECFELTVIKVLSEKNVLTGTKYRVQEELQYHVYEVVVETGKEKPMSVIIDGDVSSMVENVVRVEVSPALCVDQSVFGSRSERQERQLNFPLMTYWPVDM